MSMETWLREEGDAAGELLWRRQAEALAGPLRIGVAGCDPGVVGRVAQRVGPSAVPVVVDAGGVPAGVEDRILGVHALLWVTPAGAVLGAEERGILDILRGVPDDRVLVLGDLHLLERLVDDPEAEQAELIARAEAVSPWGVVDDAVAWARAREADPELRERRRRSLARLLGDDARTRAIARKASAEAAMETHRAALAADDERIDGVRRDAHLAAGHLLGAQKRRVEELLVALTSFLVELERALPAEIDGVADPDLAQRALPHWLASVVGGWLGDRLEEGAAAVRADLAGVVSEEDLAAVALVLPAVHPAEIRGEAQWGSRLGSTAAFGGGAALVLLGLWIPGLVALAGGVALSAAGERGRAEATRERLVETGTVAIRRLGEDAGRLMREQLGWIGREIERLAEVRVDVARQARADLRAREAARLAAREAEADAAGAEAARWDTRLAGLGAA